MELANPSTNMPAMNKSKTPVPQFQETRTGSSLTAFMKGSR